MGFNRPPHEWARALNAHGDITDRLFGSNKSRLRRTTSLTRGLQLDTMEPRILLSADLIPVAGTIEVPGETDYYTFELAEERQVLFDSLTPDSQINWTLEGEGGELVSSTPLHQSDANEGGTILALDSGTYTLRVDGVGDHTGDYQFRLLNTANAELVDPGTRVEGTLENLGRETDLFQFNAVEGTELFFDAESYSGGTAYWSLIDPDGATIFGPTTFNTNSDINRTKITKTGTYTLLLEGRVHNSSDASYAFTVEQVVDEQFDLTFDAPVFQELTQAGQVHHHNFTLGADQRVYFDFLGAQDDYRTSLVGPQGTVFSNIDLRNTDSTQRNPVWDLVSGDYTLSIGGASDNTGKYGFQILTDASARVIDQGVQFGDTVNDLGFQAGTYRVPSDAPLAGDAGNALNFGAGTARASIEDSPVLDATAFTIEGWVKPTRDDQFDVLAMRTSSNSWADGFGLFLDGTGNLVFFINNWNDVNTTVSVPLGLNEWTHVAATYEAGSLKVFLDGVLAGENAITATVNHGTGPLWIGSYGSSYYYNGQMDEFRFWSEARSASEISAQMGHPAIGTEDGLVASFGFDESFGTEFANRVADGPSGGFTDGPATETHVYKLTASAGDRLVIDGTHTGGLNFRVIAESGNVIYGPTGVRLVDPLVIPDDGEYTLLVEGYVYESIPRS
ncbi:MAG: LamG-like jellyroll fold domain-containing protein, partial [Arenibacterium sp.]